MLISYVTKDLISRGVIIIVELLQRYVGRKQIGNLNLKVCNQILKYEIWKYEPDS